MFNFANEFVRRLVFVVAPLFITFDIHALLTPNSLARADLVGNRPLFNIS